MNRNSIEDEARALALLITRRANAACTQYNTVGFIPRFTVNPESVANLVEHILTTPFSEKQHKEYGSFLGTTWIEVTFTYYSPLLSEVRICHNWEKLQQLIPTMLLSPSSRATRHDVIIAISLPEKVLEPLKQLRSKVKPPVIPRRKSGSRRLTFTPC